MSDLTLFDAVNAGDSAEAERLIKNGAEVNQQDEQGWTPLNFAAGKGDLSMTRLLVDNGADVFKVGRDRRTPYMIALAAGRVSVVKYLAEVEDRVTGEVASRQQRKYCKAYHIGDLRKYSGWSESRLNWKKRDNGNGGNAGNGNGDRKDDGEGAFPDEKVVFIHQDFTVTESAWHNENVIFDRVDSGWEEFCLNSLAFKVPTDLDLIVPNEN